MVVGDPLSLDRIRSVLTRLEDTIIFSLIERAQFAHNPRIYQRRAFQELMDLSFQGSWLEWFLKETETFHGEFHPASQARPGLTEEYFQAKARRYTRYVSTSHQSHAETNPAFPVQMNIRSVPTFRIPFCHLCRSQKSYTRIKLTPTPLSSPSTFAPSSPA